MCQRPAASRVLLIGGGVAGDAREILRYPAVDEVTYVELDPAIIEAGRRLVPANLDDSRITIAAADGRRFVQESRGSFDVIIVDLPDPSTSLINRYYTAGFFAEAHRALRPEASWRSASAITRISSARSWRASLPRPAEHSEAPSGR